ncbi:FAD-binding protein [Falsiroseomonas ponticola]|uniref:FAD-dependent oxidoreductase n=1 Tax=Falsiroseomonas ponticola TaxID=2786951 RepID=UPI0019329DB7|nr:FAD-binding oxidoreductase [Roseomonas ponticola]
MPITRRDALTATALLPAAALSPRIGAAQSRIVMNDASRLNPTPVARHWRPATDRAGAWHEALRAELRDAAAARRPVVVGAARHSMGAQSLARDGTGITLTNPWFELDRANGIARVSAGATWSEIIGWLDPQGLSPKVMQSNADFGAAATFSVNAHGWPVPHGPFASTVRSCRVMLADGTILDCARDRNAELFGLMAGGYGLFGVILDLDIEVVPNLMLRPYAQLLPGADFAEAFIPQVARDPTVSMAYGRLSVAREALFEDAILTVSRAVSPQPATLPPAANHSLMTGISNTIYRQQIGSETAKRLRWVAETRLMPAIGTGLATRNTLMVEPVSNLANTARRRTDILHEYFVPPERFRDFRQACRDIIPPAAAEFINVTLRYVGTDELSVLRYAPQPRIAAVMSFSQDISAEGEADMLLMTEALVERVIALGGAYYLPYRLHTRRDQFQRAYPRAAFFAERKRHYDPGLLFRHALWDGYLA